MATNKKPTGRASSMPAGMLTGGAAAMGVILAGAAVVAWLVSGERMEESAIGYGIMVVLIVSSYIGALIAAGRIKRRRLLACAGTSGVVFASLLAITALFFGGQYSAVPETALLVLCGGMLAAMTRMERGGKRKKIKIPSR